MATQILQPNAVQIVQQARDAMLRDYHTSTPRAATLISTLAPSARHVQSSTGQGWPAWLTQYCINLYEQPFPKPAQPDPDITPKDQAQKAYGFAEQVAEAVSQTVNYPKALALFAKLITTSIMENANPEPEGAQAALKAIAEGPLALLLDRAAEGDLPHRNEWTSIMEATEQHDHTINNPGNNPDPIVDRTVRIAWGIECVASMGSTFMSQPMHLTEAEINSMEHSIYLDSAVRDFTQAMEHDSKARNTGMENQAARNADNQLTYKYRDMLVKALNDATG